MNLVPSDDDAHLAHVSSPTHQVRAQHTRAHSSPRARAVIRAQRVIDATPA